MRPIAWVLATALLVPASVCAEGFDVSGYVEGGKRSTAEGYQEENNNDDYTCNKLFLDRDLDLSADFKFRYTDFAQRNNTDQESGRAGLNYYL